MKEHSGKEEVYLYSMGQRLKITAIFTDDDAANAHMAKSDDAVVACFGRFIICANKYDKGLREYQARNALVAAAAEAQALVAANI